MAFWVYLSDGEETGWIVVRSIFFSVDSLACWILLSVFGSGGKDGWIAEDLSQRKRAQFSCDNCRRACARYTCFLYLFPYAFISRQFSSQMILFTPLAHKQLLSLHSSCITKL
ncbi:hypothetical protein RvY_17929 [Ramazzottius varieornatus]|uniref:Uncharacterized protein n=1 Tax=Ramazzottius varieornatus TaxID=947166 RepID=A0A1D1W435_RAMVA|nr:hypothetical protein RvY_17929 [Ramazzottius varieornatus]